MLTKINSKPIYIFTLFFTLAYLILHYQAHMYLTGGVIPPNSDSLSYQYSALDALHSIATNTFSLQTFLFGDDINHVPPIYKSVLLFSYMIGGMTSGSEYLINYFIVLLGGYYLGKISFLIYENKNLQYYTFLAYITLHGVTVFSFYDTRNDTLAITLYILAIYYLFKSDFFYDRKFSIVVSVFIALALLTKSAFAGYIILPFILLLFMVYKTDKNHIRFKNIVLSTSLIVLLIGWFYAIKFHAIMDYYTFWSHELSSVVSDQYNLRTVYDKIFFYPKSTFDHFGFLLYFLALLWVHQAFLILVKKRTISFGRNDKVIFLLSLIIFPYTVLLATGSYSIVVDLYMVPFILIIMMSVLNQYREHKLLEIMTLSVIAILGFSNILHHYKMPLSKNIDYYSFSYQLDKIISQYGTQEKSAFALFDDLDLDMKTIAYTNMKNTYLRNKSYIKIADVSYKTRVSPKLTATNIYSTIKAQSDIILITDKSKGPTWININKKWEKLSSIIKTDKDMVKLGDIAAYADQTKVDIYIKNNINYNLSLDGWLLNSSTLTIIANPNKYLIKVIDISKMSNINKLFLKTEHGDSYPLLKNVSDGVNIFTCELNIDKINNTFYIYSDKPLVPSKTSNSTDKRSLLLFKPKITLQRSY